MAEKKRKKPYLHPFMEDTGIKCENILKLSGEDDNKGPWDPQTIMDDMWADWK